MYLALMVVVLLGAGVGLLFWQAAALKRSLADKEAKAVPDSRKPLEPDSRKSFEPDYKKMLEQERRRSALLGQNRDNTALALDVAHEQLKAAREDCRRAQADKINSDARLRDQIAKLELVEARATTLSERLQAENSSLITLQKIGLRRVDEALAVNARYRQQKEALARSKAQLEELLAESRAACRRAEALAKVYREQAAIAARDLEEATDVIAKYKLKYVPLTDDKLPGKAPPIVATILAVKEGIASINAGSAKGVRPGMRLIVHRGERLVGYLKIIEVEAQESAGLLVDDVMKAQQGDKVTSKPAPKATPKRRP